MTVTTPLVRTPRVVQVEGMFDVPPSERAELTWDVELPLDERPWNIGLLVGPSGSGKTTIGRRFWPDQIGRQYPWPDDKSVLDGFPSKMPVKEVIKLLSSVGFSSPPAWLRPFRALSNGEQFRVTLARVLAEQHDLAVVDEFTSVVDRTVAQIGAAALARTVRQRKQQFIALTCHEDVVDWLQPDWIYRPNQGGFAWRSLQRRPPIELEIARVHHSAWEIFKHHHYMTEHMHRGALCFAAFWRGTPVAFVAQMHFPSSVYDLAYKGSRLVVLPDYQGAGIGPILEDFVGSLIRAIGGTLLATSGHPAMNWSHYNSPNWKVTRRTSMQLTGDRRGGLRSARMSPLYAQTGLAEHRASLRMTAGFEYVGPIADRQLALDMLGLEDLPRPWPRRARQRRQRRGRSLARSASAAATSSGSSSASK